jgi:prefoldin subunit 5
MALSDKEIIDIDTGLVSFQFQITNLKTAQDLTDQTVYEKEIAKLVKSKKPEFTNWLRGKVASLGEGVHTINIASIKLVADGIGYKVQYSYDYPDLESEYEELLEEYESLVERVNKLTSERDDLQRRAAKDLKSARRRRSISSRVQRTLGDLERKIGSGNALVRSIQRKMSSIRREINSSVDQLETINRKTMVSLQQGIEVSADKLIRNEPVPIATADGSDVYMSKLSLNSVIRSNEIPPFVKSQYIMARYTEELVNKEYPKLVLEALDKIAGK